MSLVAMVANVAGGDGGDGGKCRWWRWWQMSLAAMVANVAGGDGGDGGRIRPAMGGGISVCLGHVWVPGPRFFGAQRAALRALLKKVFLDFDA